MKSIIVVLLSTIILYSCATTARFEENLQSWLGHDINELTQSWGYPSNSFKAPNGNLVYVYSQSSFYTSPTTYSTYGNVTRYGNTAYGNATTYKFGGQTYQRWCNIFFEVDESNRIILWRWEGNDCRQ